MSLPASTSAEPSVFRLRPGSRWHAGLGLIAVVLAYLGIALGAAHLLPSKPAAGLTTVGTETQRPHLFQRDRGPAAVTHREIDPPRGDRPTGVAGLVAAVPTPVAGGPVRGLARLVDVVAAAAPRAFLPRGPPEDGRAVAA